MNDVYAHSLDDRPMAEWEALARHLSAVGEKAESLAAAFGWGEAARVAGRLHDIGKCSAQFQAHIRDSASRRGRGGDHSTAGARTAAVAYPGGLGRMLAFIIAGHHAGLADAASLDGRLDPAHEVPAYPGWERHCGALPKPAALLETKPNREADKGFTGFFLTRMLFSCLVDADSSETERFITGSAGRLAARGGHLGLEALRDRLRAYMQRKRAGAGSSKVNALRSHVLDRVVAQAVQNPGLFTLTVPTGGGKTLASLSFALEHAVRHGLRRVVYVIPYTSIIEQTAAVFREALGTDDDVLEHHASFDWDEAGRAARDADGAGADGLAKLRRASENWDVPVVVTTAVQFFESLFAARRSQCRKLHNLAGSVIILDEAQTLPLPLLHPCMAALDELASNYRASIVLCTATQPALRCVDGFKRGFAIDGRRELAPDPAGLYAALRRVRVEWLADPVDDGAIAARFAEQERMLCIVNTRAHARWLFDAIAGLPGAVHLTTLMCPRHRRAVLDEQRRRLGEGLPVRLVATSLIEAGVDIDFPEVWRAATGLDSIAQAAGRCNREGELLGLGRTVVFQPAEVKPPRGLEPLIGASATVMRTHDDPLTLEAMRSYFAEIYWRKGEVAFDSAEVDGQPGILPSIRTRAHGFGYLFASIADAFRMIDEAMEPVIVPWCAHDEDQEAERLLQRIARAERPLAEDLRALQQYTVGIPRQLRAEWLAQGVLRPVHPKMGAVLLRLDDLAHYRPETGLDIGSPTRRDSESNVM